MLPLLVIAVMSYDLSLSKTLSVMADWSHNNIQGKMVGMRQNGWRQCFYIYIVVACVCCVCVLHVCMLCVFMPQHKSYAQNSYVYIYTQSDSLQLRALRLVHQKASVRHWSHSTAECWQSADLHSWLRLVWTKASGSKGPYAHPARTLPAKRKQGMVHVRSSGQNCLSCNPLPSGI